MLSRPASSVTPSPGFVPQRLQPVPLLVGQIARVHAPTLSTQHLSAYSFQGSFASFWTDSQTTRGLEVKKLAVMVGRFTVEDEVKAGAMGPNSPAMKFSGTEDCRWTPGGFAVICEATLSRPGKEYSETSFAYYDPTSKTYQYHAVDSSGAIENKTGTVNGDVWTWLGESIFAGKTYHTRYTMKFVSPDSYEYTDESGESESSMKVFVSGKETRVTANPAKSQSAQ
jgi:hypothetical protein